MLYVIKDKGKIYSMQGLKKINIILFLIVFFLGSFAFGIYQWVSWKNKTADNVNITDNEKLEVNSDQVQGPEKILKTIERAKAAVLGEETEMDKNTNQQAESPAPVNDQINNENAAGSLTSRGFTFAAIGDSESYNSTGYEEEFPNVLSQVKLQNPDLVFFTGDILVVDDPNVSVSRPRIKNLKNLIERYFSKYYITFGNHDVECGEKCIDMWFEVFFNEKNDASGQTGKRNLTYSFDYENTHFVLLSSVYPEKMSIDNDQLNWLEQDLAKTDKENKIVFSHVPPVTFFEQSALQCHDMSCNSLQRDKLISILKRYKVDVVVSGHEHAFDHKIVDGINYVLSGNSGNKPKYKGVIEGQIYSIFKIKGTNISLTALNTKGKIIREINLKR